MQRWFTDSTSLQIMLAVSVLASKWLLSLFLVEEKCVVPRTIGGLDSGSVLRNIRRFYVHLGIRIGGLPLVVMGRRKTKSLAGNELRSDKLPDIVGCTNRHFVRLLCDPPSSFIIDMNMMRWWVRLWNAFLAEVVKSRRDMLCDRRQ